MIGKCSNEVPDCPYSSRKEEAGEELGKNWVFSPEICERIHQKRMELHASFTKVASVLDVNWATVRKWEKGMIACCNALNQQKISSFLSGRYDEKFNKRGVFGGAESAELEEVHQLFSQLLGVYGLSGHSHQAGRMIIHLLTGGIHVILKEIYQNAFSDEEYAELSRYLRHFDLD